MQFGQGQGLVIGFETDIQYADLNNQRRDNGFYSFGPGNVSNNIVFVGPAGNRGVDYFGTVRGRLGYAFDRALVYGTGGFAYGAGGEDDNFAYGRRNDTRIGYAVGGGLEYAMPTSFLNFFGSNAVTFKVEGLYVDLSRDGRKSEGSVFAYDVANNIPYVTTGGNRRLDDTQFAVVRAGLNYKFGTQ